MTASASAYSVNGENSLHPFGPSSSRASRTSIPRNFDTRGSATTRAELSRSSRVGCMIPSLTTSASVRVILVTEPGAIAKVPIKVVPIYFDVPATIPVDTEGTTDAPPTQPRAKTAALAVVADCGCRCRRGAARCRDRCGHRRGFFDGNRSCCCLDCARRRRPRGRDSRNCSAPRAPPRRRCQHSGDDRQPVSFARLAALLRLCGGLTALGCVPKATKLVEDRGRHDA